MRYLFDSNVWITFLRKPHSPVTARLQGIFATRCCGGLRKHSVDKRGSNASLLCSQSADVRIVLAEVIASLEDRYAEEQRALLAEKLAEVRRESDEKVAKADSERRIAEAKARAEKLVGEEAAIKIVADAKRRQEQLAQERKKKEDEAREAALEKEYESDLPQIRQSRTRTSLAHRNTSPCPRCSRHAAE